MAADSTERGAPGGGGWAGDGEAPRMGGGAAAARAYIARTNPNGNSSLGGASPIMHTPVLTGRSLDPFLSLSLSRSRIVPHSASLPHLITISLSLCLSILPRHPRNLRVLLRSSPLLYLNDSIVSCTPPG